MVFLRCCAGRNQSWIFFWSQVEKYFVLNHRDVLCFKAKDFLHCTRRLNRRNLLGLAFFQKCSLYRHLGRLILPNSRGVIVYKNRKRFPNTIKTKEGFIIHEQEKKLYRTCIKWIIINWRFYGKFQKLCFCVQYFVSFN